MFLRNVREAHQGNLGLIQYQTHAANGLRSIRSLNLSIVELQDLVQSLKDNSIQKRQLFVDHSLNLMKHGPLTVHLNHQPRSIHLTRRENLLGRLRKVLLEVAPCPLHLCNDLT